jgi:(R,R)-butanediol dehydrogenase/meso-butanediol dehydrogenase/diacetyl reductase
MRAAVFEALGEPLVVATVADPIPAADEVIVRVGRCGICGSDLHMTQEPAFGVRSGTVLGHEFAGEVVELGAQASTLKVGDRVAVAPLRGCGHCASCLQGQPAWCSRMSLQGGGYAEYAAVTERQCHKLPAMTSVADGALVEPLAVALHGLSVAGLQPGARVLVMGAGPIGLGVAHWARRLGATDVVVSDLTTLKADLAHTIGATGFVKADADVVESVRTSLGGAPDIVFECVGRPGMLAQALEHVRVHGSIVLLGLCTSQDSFIPFRAVSKEVRFLTSAYFTIPEYRAALDALNGGTSTAQALVTDTVSLAAMPAMFESLRQQTAQCKVLVTMDAHAEPGR